MARKAINSVELLLRLEKQKMDELRLEIFKVEEQLAIAFNEIEVLHQKIIDERELNSTQIETGKTYSFFQMYHRKKRRPDRFDESS